MIKKVRDLIIGLFITFVIINCSAVVNFIQFQVTTNENLDSQNENFNGINRIPVKETWLDNEDFEQSYQTTRGKVADRIINRNRIVNYTSDLVLGNLTILDDATLNVENCELEIRGKLTIIDNGRLFVKNSNITIAPGPVDQQEIIINFSNNAKVRIEGSNIYTYPQPTLTNISYLLSDDNTEVTIINSYMNCKLPSILHLDIELTPPTAGTFILTGDTVWNIFNTKTEGFLKITDEGKLESRWFLFTLQRNAQLFMKNSYGFMNDASQPFIKPVAGYVKIEDSVIPNGVIDVEVVAEFEAINLSIEDINFRDQTKSKLIRSTIGSSLDVGSVAIIPSVSGTKMVIDPNQQKPKSELYIEDSNIGQTFVSQGNSTINLKNAVANICTITADSTIFMENCDIKNLVEVKDNGTLNLENTTVHKINLADRSILNIKQSKDSFPITSLTTRFNSQSKILLHSTTIKSVEIFGGDLEQPPYNSGYDPNLNVSNIEFVLIDSTIKKLKTEDDAEIYLELQNSQVDDFSFKKVKEEPVTITILDLGGEFTIPKTWPEIELTFYIYHQVIVSTEVNENPVMSMVFAKDQDGNKIYSTHTNDQGIIILEFLFETIKNNVTTPAGNYQIILDYLGFSKEITTSAEIDDEYNVQWFDSNPPVISNIKIDTEYHRTKRPSRISARIIDLEIKVIANATIYYKYSKDGGWSKWFTTNMLEVKNNTFEAEVKYLPDGTEIRFYIVSYDILGNKQTSPDKSYILENPDMIIVYITIIILIMIIILGVLSFLKRRGRLREYIKVKSINRSNEPHESRVIYENTK